MYGSQRSLYEVDVLIVGSSLAGAAVARMVRDAREEARIMMIDCGPTLGAVPGQHLHDVDDPQLWREFNRREEVNSQAAYIGPEIRSTTAADVSSLPPGMHTVGSFAEESREFPAAAMAWNVGGMGVHWTCSCPVPGGDEVFALGDEQRWSSDLADVFNMLQVDRNPYGRSRTGAAIRRLLGDRFDAVSAEGRTAQPMPTAVAPHPDGPWTRTGPSQIFPALGTGSDERFELRPGALALRVAFEDGRALGVHVRDVSTDAESFIPARHVVVAADALRSPQLLFASGIRPPALGRYLNEHAFLHGFVRPDLDKLGVRPEDLPPMHPREARAGNHWQPHNDAAQPHHLQVTETYLGDSRDPEGYVLVLTVYVRTDIDAENRVEFDEREVDLAGMPRMRFHFRRTSGDLAAIESGVRFLEEVARLFGKFDFATQGAVADPGASLHYTGTVRMGERNDGTSVCDRDARVWGFENLYVAGNGVVPTAVVSNVTPAGLVTAVRAGKTVARLLEEETGQ